MATYKTHLIDNRMKHRGIYSGQEYTIEGVIKLPSGAALTTADVFLIAPIGENQVIKEVWAYGLGTPGSLAISIGYAQRLDADGNPEIVWRYGPMGGDEGKFTSPASDLDAFAPAAVVSTARRVVDTAPEKLAGPVNLAAAVTTGQTLAGPLELHIGAVLVGELSDREVADPYFGFDNGYLIGA